jgi:hypothetical protein
MTKIEILLVIVLAACLIYCLILGPFNKKPKTRNILRTTIPVDQTRWITEGVILTYSDGTRVKVMHVDHLNKTIEVEKD